MSLSVVIPTKGDRKQLLVAVYSCLRSPLVHQIIVVHGPKGLEKSKVEKEIRQLQRVKIFECDKMGANRARNFGAKQVRTRYVVFLDDDCEVISEKSFSYLLETLNRGVDAIGGFYCSPKNDSWVGTTYNAITNAWLLSQSDASGSSGLLVGGFCAYHLNQFVDAGGFDESMQGAAEEHRLNQRLYSEGKQLINHEGLLVFHHFARSTYQLLSNAFRHGFETRRASSEGPQRHPVFCLGRGLQIASSRQSLWTLSFSVVGILLYVVFNRMGVLLKLCFRSQALGRRA